MPAIALPSTAGKHVDLSTVSGLAVLIVYPYTGRPGLPNPPNWDNISGAHGSTPQLLGFSKHYDGFRSLDVKLFGLSQLHLDWQKDFAGREELPFPLLSDFDLRFARALGLPSFETGGASFLARSTFVLNNGVIAHHRSDYANPASDAEDMLSLIRHGTRT